MIPAIPGGPGSSIVGMYDGEMTMAEIKPNGDISMREVPASIRVLTQPAKTRYTDGQSIQYSGLTIELLDADGKTFKNDDFPTGVLTWGAPYYVDGDTEKSYGVITTMKYASWPEGATVYTDGDGLNVLKGPLELIYTSDSDPLAYFPVPVKYGKNGDEYGWFYPRTGELFVGATFYLTKYKRHIYGEDRTMLYYGCSKDKSDVGGPKWSDFFSFDLFFGSKVKTTGGGTTVISKKFYEWGFEWEEQGHEYPNVPLSTKSPDGMDPNEIDFAIAKVKVPVAWECPYSHQTHETYFEIDVRRDGGNPGGDGQATDGQADQGGGGAGHSF